MYLGEAVYTSKLLKDSDMMDLVEDPYVIVIEDPSLAFKWPIKIYKHQDMASVITLLHAKGWETVNISPYGPGSLMALLKNPHAKHKNQPETQG